MLSPALVKKLGYGAVGTALAANGVAIAVRPDLITTTYGVPVDPPDLQVLLHHRGVMLGLLGGLLAAAGPVRSLRGPATLTAAVSMGSFVAIAAAAPTLRAAQERVAHLDVGLLVLLAVVAALPEGRRRPLPSTDGSSRGRRRGTAVVRSVRTATTGSPDVATPATRRWTTAPRR